MTAPTRSSFINFIVYSDRLAEDLWVAVHENNINRVRTLLQQGANPSHPVYWREHWWRKPHGGWSTRSPPLYTACYIGNLEIVKLLIQAGADVNERDDESGTPLHAACRQSHKEVALYLIKEAGCKTGECVLLLVEVTVLPFL